MSGKHTFKAEEKIRFIREKSVQALKLSLNDAVVDLQSGLILELERTVRNINTQFTPQK